MGKFEKKMEVVFAEKLFNSLGLTGNEFKKIKDGDYGKSIHVPDVCIVSKCEWLDSCKDYTLLIYMYDEVDDEYHCVKKLPGSNYEEETFTMGDMREVWGRIASWLLQRRIEGHIYDLDQEEGRPDTEICFERHYCDEVL
jgi:hypothetical protein